MNNGEHGGEDAASRIRLLETKYIELLEKRVAELEGLTSKSTTADTKPTKTQAGTASGTDAKDVTSNDRMEQFRAKRESAAGSRSSSVGSTTGTRIRFREIKYNNDGVEVTKEVSDTEELKVDQSDKPKDAPDMVWTRRYDENHKYKYSEVQVLSPELRDMFRVMFAKDPRMHIVADSKNDLPLVSPFGPLLQKWGKLQKLAENSVDADIWQKIKKKIEEAKRIGHTITVEQNPDKTLAIAREHLVTLMDRIRSSPEIESYLSAIDTAVSNHTIQFDNLWTIFPPGELVYSPVFMKKDQVFVVKECNSRPVLESDTVQSSKDSRKVWYLHCWSYDWNGSTFTRVPVVFKFEEFSGAKLINTLHCHPLSYHFPDDDTNAKRNIFEEDLIARGKLFREYCIRTDGEQMFEYEGDAISHGSGFQRLKNKGKQSSREDRFLALFLGRRRETTFRTSELRQISGRVMVDFNSYIQHAPNESVYAPMGDITFSSRDDECGCGTCTSNKALRKNQRRDFDRWAKNEPFTSDEQYLLCPPRVLGYHLDTRTWLELQIIDIKVIEEKSSDAAFNKLQLDEDHKILIRNLVQSHSSSTQKQPMMQDIIKGKGKGLVMLLHGPPGVGKTLTAEGVASLTGKPLFAVSPSDIGLDAAEVEHNLQSLFALAARWRAVLLFDEADVFLESRSANTSDITRNALVSVLLRVLEYYEGILILTTNRIKQFDIAVQSRVTLGIRYRKLDHSDKQVIFEQFIDDVKKKNIEDRDKIIKWFKTSEAKEWFEPLNGRQVRNVLFSAASLGSMDGDLLYLENIKTMAKITFKFQDSLRVEMDMWAKQNEAGRHYNHE